MIGVSMGDNDALDFLGVTCCRSAKAAGQIASEHLVVAAVDKDDFSIRRFNDRSVSLLDIDEIDLEHLVVL